MIEKNTPSSENRQDSDGVSNDVPADPAAENSEVAPANLFPQDEEKSVMGPSAAEEPAVEHSSDPVPEAEVDPNTLPEAERQPEAEVDPNPLPEAEPQPEGKPERELEAEPVSEKDQFDRPLHLPDEKQIPLKHLSDWEYHCAGLSRQSYVADAGLKATAFTPDRMPPLEVIKRGDDNYAVKDGRRRLSVLRDAYHNQPDTKIRCNVYQGTEEQAVEEMCEDAVGKIARTPIETAIAVDNVHRVSGVTQQAIILRYPELNKDKVSRMLKAAQAFKEYPTVFNLLKEPDRVPIDTCVRVHDQMKGASDEELGAYLSRAEALSADGVSFSTGELLEAFGIDGPAKKAGGPRVDPFAPIDTTDVFGDDDQVIGALDMHSDNVTRLRLPDPHAMTIEEREVAANAFIKQIYAYFELDAD